MSSTGSKTRLTLTLAVLAFAIFTGVTSADEVAIARDVPDVESTVEPLSTAPLQTWWFQPKWLGYRKLAWSSAFESSSGGSTNINVWANARSFFSLDKRIDFSGQETTIGVEAQTLATLSHHQNGWTTSATGEFYLNQPFDKNLLTDYALRESFRHNFETDPFEISQLFITVATGDWALDAGRFVTPFGRFEAPVFGNARIDAPFIRTEAILFRETGLQLRYQPGSLRLAAAITNGSDGKDTNSSKAIVARAGYEWTNMTLGSSVKWQDGIGSEGQKEFNNHAGLDLAFRFGKLTLSSEVIYDQYGLRRPGTGLDEIDWGRSIYNRQLNNGLGNPIEGLGWYVNAAWESAISTTVIQYGQFHPEQIGDAIHDETTRRLTFKQIRAINQSLDLFLSTTFENPVENAQDGRTRRGFFLLTGFQFNF